MKVTFRTVTGTSFSLDLDDKSKVGHQASLVTDMDASHIAHRSLYSNLVVQVSDVKAKLRQDKGDAFPEEHQVLIFQGKVS